MSRFREEVYASKSNKAQTARRRRGPETPDEADARKSRAEYFKNSPEARKAIRKATQARLNGF